MGSENYKKRVEELSKKPENQTCVDCNAKYPRWISTYYGTFICLECAGTHRSLGVYLDFVKSLGLDSWDKNSALPVIYGGNKNFLEHLKKIGNVASGEDKYKDPKVIEYSKDLASVIKKNEGVDIRTPTISKSTLNRRRYCDNNPVDLKHNTDYARTEKQGGMSLSNIESIKNTLSKHASTLKEKSKIYGLKLGSSIGTGAKKLAGLGSSLVTALKKSDTEVDNMREAPKLTPRRAKTEDWS